MDYGKQECMGKIPGRGSKAKSHDCHLRILIQRHLLDIQAWGINMRPEDIHPLFEILPAQNKKSDGFSQRSFDSPCRRTDGEKSFKDD